MQNNDASQTNTAAAAANGGGQPYIAVKSVWKVFGRNPERVLAPEYIDKDKSVIQSELGNVIGLRDVNFAVEQGETFMIMGLSGSGKSTMVRCLLRLIEPTSGQIVIDGDDITRMTDNELVEFRRRKIAMVFPALRADAAPQCHRQRRLGAGNPGGRQRGTLRPHPQDFGSGGLERLGKLLSPAAFRGMQQRVGLARALVVDTDILLMDEPSAAWIR